MISIRQLLPADSSAWKDLRIQLLINHPTFFGASLEDEKRLTDKRIKDWLATNIILGAFSNEVLVGILGFSVFEGKRRSHRGLVFGIYVDPKHRGNGVGAQLLETIIKIAKKKVLQLHLEVASENHNAIRLYRRYGFESTGVDLRCLKVGEQFYDENLMVLKLDGKM